MKQVLLVVVATLLLGAHDARAQTKLSVKWEELSAADFRRAIAQSKGTCLLPFGILEKHGPHLSLGTDLLNVRYASLHAAEKEYAVVFPEYYFGQIFEAKHEPGTMAYSRELQLRLLQETTDEMARNGCKKIVIVNGHGGNESLLPFFAQSQLEKPHDYVVYVQWGHDEPKGGPQKKDVLDMHAGQSETSTMMISHPDLVHLDQASSESGADFPNHYSGEGALATKELGEFEMNAWINAIAAAIRAAQADDQSLRLQNEFYEKSRRPLDTRP